MNQDNEKLTRELVSLGAQELAKLSNKLNTTGRGVFKPTATSSFMLKCAKKKVTKNDQVLDLGCGWGILGLELGMIYKNEIKMHFSDLSEAATISTERNLAVCNIEGIVKTGSLFEPWSGFKFDLIIADVSGISELVPLRDLWFDGIPMTTGKEGTDLTRQVILHSKKYLTTTGKLILPLISLANTSKMLELIHSEFQKVVKCSETEWSLKILNQEIEFELNSLRNQGIIQFEKRDGVYFFKTEIYILEK